MHGVLALLDLPLYRPPPVGEGHDTLKLSGPIGDNDAPRGIALRSSTSLLVTRPGE